MSNFFYDLNKKIFNIGGPTDKQKLAEDASWGMAEEKNKSEIDINRLKKLAHGAVKEAEVKEFAQDADDDVPGHIHVLANQWWNATDDQPRIASKLRSLGYIIKQTDSEEDEVELTKRDGKKFYISADTFDPDMFESEVADKDYDKDGKIESPKDEVWGARAKAAAKAGKPFNEADVTGLGEGAPADEDAVRELVLFADNNADLYRQSYEPIIKNLQRKVNKGIYDAELAKKLWGYHAERAAKSYAQQHGDGTPWNRMFSPEDRRSAAAQFEEQAREEIGADSLEETQTDDAVARFQDKQQAEKMKRLTNPRDYFEDALDDDSTDDDMSDEAMMESLSNMLEGKSKKSKTEKEDKKAEKAGKKVAKDIEYDEKHKGKDDDKAEKSGKKVTKDIEYDDKKDRDEKDVPKKTKDAIKKVVIPAQRDEAEKYQVTGRVDPKKFKKEFVNKEMKKIDEQLSYMGEDAQARQYNGKGHNNAMPGIEFEDTASSSGGTIARKGGVTKHTAGGRYAALDVDADDEDAPKVKKAPSGLGRGRPTKEKAPEYTKINDPFGRAPKTIPKGKKGEVHKMDEASLNQDLPEKVFQQVLARANELDDAGEMPQDLINILKDELYKTGKYNKYQVGHAMGKIADMLDLVDPDDEDEWSLDLDESTKPDFLDMDKDGNKSEPMKKAVTDKKQNRKEVDEVSSTEKQARTMAAAAHNPKFAKKVGIEQGVAKEFNKADKGTKLLSKAMKHRKVKESDADFIGAPDTEKAVDAYAEVNGYGDPNMYEAMNKKLEKLISLNESVDVQMARHDIDGAEQEGAIMIQADGAEADLIKDLLKNAGLINYENDLISQQSTQNVEPDAVAISVAPEAPLDISQFCPVCDCIPCGCDSMQDNGEEEIAFELEEGAMKDAMWRDAERMERAEFCEKWGDENGEFWDNICGDLVEADAPVTDNEPDWPTNQETSDDALQYAGGLNKPKSTGQTTTPIIASQLNRQHSMEENVDLERSLFKTWKNYKG